ncbi:MAG: alpha-E domain-containing protein [Planctomycetaceae bacterium]|nr:alpha-E domain-containing protein [Planctomycetaceae bacterium]
MLSRVADCVYWMSRYLERAENIARFVDVNYNLSLDLGNRLREQWEPLVYTSGDHEDFVERYGHSSQRNVINFLTFDVKNMNSVLACLSAARENARTVRDIISSAVFEELNKFYHQVKNAAHDPRVLEEPHDFFHQVKRNSHLILGMLDATISRDEAWYFAHVGRLIERADKTSRILDVKYYILLPQVADVGTPLDSIQWAALLKSAGALEMYRKSRGRITPRDVVDFLLFDREFPRAIRFCLSEAEESLLAILGTAHSMYRNEAERRIGQLSAEIDYAQVDDIIRTGLHEYLDSFQTKLNAVGGAISESFFGHTSENATPVGAS